MKVQGTFPGPATFDATLNVEDFARPAMKTVLVLLGWLGLEADDALAGAWRYVGGSDVGADVKAHWSVLPGPWNDDCLGTAPHAVTVRSEPDAELVTADVRYFGDLAICFRIRARLALAFEVGYGADPFTGREVRYGGRIGFIDVPGAAGAGAVYNAIGRAFGRIKRAGVPRGLAALGKRVAEECTRKVIGGRVEPESHAEREAILACVSEELAFILRRENSEEDAPALLADLQAAANKVRARGR